MLLGLACELEPRIKPNYYCIIGGAWKAILDWNRLSISQSNFQLLY